MQAGIPAVRCRRRHGRAGILSQPGLDRRPAGRAADRRGGRGLPGLGDARAGTIWSAIEPVRARAITAEKLAVNAVMAGCLPMHFPVVVAAFTAMLREPFLLHGATSSTGGCAVLVIVNGADRRRDRHGPDLQCARPPATGPRRRSAGALRLCLINLLDVRARRYRPLVARPSRKDQLLPRRGRGGLGMAAALRRTRHAGRCVLRHGDGGRRAAAIDERMDDGSGRDPRYLCRRNARQHAPLFDLAGQLLYRRAAAAARPFQRRRMVQGRYPRVSVREGAYQAVRVGRMRQGGRWCATAAAANMRH